MNYETINNFKILKEKNPTLSGIISIIPGAGYFYTGHKQTAVSAFVINSLLAYATFTNIKSKNYGMAILTGIFNLSFYIGNFQGSIKSVSMGVQLPGPAGHSPWPTGDHGFRHALAHPPLKPFPFASRRAFRERITKLR